MEIKNFVKTFDNVFSVSVVSALIRYCNTIQFYDAAVVHEKGEAVDKKTRDTQNISLNQLDKSLTNVHYANLIGKTLTDVLKNYCKEYLDFCLEGINDIQILKYSKGGFYTWHTDHAGIKIPRTMSIVTFLNNDYEGGELSFRNPDGTGEYKIEPKVGRVVAFPSNFMYPHTVVPVRKGTRYTVVAWAI
jgi:predicted 2-oxoglutarate/Fe(II)-dependent dioxygenase YbiX